MKKIIYIFLFLFSSGDCVLAQFQQDWVSRFNNAVSGEDDAYSIDVDHFGNSYVTGRSYNGYNYDIITVKYSQQGSLLWIRTFNGSANQDDIPVKMRVDSEGNIYVSGNTRHSAQVNGEDFLILKYNSAGNVEWSKTYNGIDNLQDNLKDLTIDSAGYVYVTGIIGRYNFADYCTIKYNSNGDTVWTRKYRDSIFAYSNPSSILVDNSGNVYVTGCAQYSPVGSDVVTIKYSAIGQILWNKRYTSANSGYSYDYVNDIMVDGFGNVFITGSQQTTGNSDFCTIKYNSVGVQQWVVVYNYGIDDSKSIVVDNIGNSYITGESGFRICTIKYNQNGIQQWIRRYDEVSKSNKMVIDLSGNIYITGVILNNFITVKYNSLGDNLWESRYNGPAGLEDYSNDIIVGVDNNVYVTGQSFGSGTHFDYCTIKYSQPIGINPISSEIPNEFSLFQNYPNPFNPSTKIKFAIPTGYASQTILSVYDILGRRVAVLVNQQLRPGTYEVDWDASAYPSGVYFYTITSGSFKETRKMVLLK